MNDVRRFSIDRGPAATNYDLTRAIDDRDSGRFKCTVTSSRVAVDLCVALELVARMLRLFGEDIWTADGPTISVAGFDYPTRMIVIRLSDGVLFIWSPVALSSNLKAAVDLLGPVRHIVAPNSLHHTFFGDWQRAYPEAKSHAVPQLRKKRPDLNWDSDLDDIPEAQWSKDIDQVVVRGNRITTEVVFSIVVAEQQSSPT